MNNNISIGSRLYISQVQGSGYGRGVTGYPGPQVCTLLGHGAGDGAALHLALIVHNHASVVLKMKLVLL